MAPITAIVFDLYGTLFDVGERLLPRHVPRLLGADGARWMELMRGPLLTRPFPDRETFVRFVCDTVAPGRPADAEAQCRALLDRELASVSPVDGALSLLAFLHRRGYALGLLSNLSSVHKEPVTAHQIDQWCPTMVFSCDEGLCKPDPRVYRAACSRLGQAAGQVLMVGDSRQNDVEVPMGLGMQAIHVSGVSSARTLATVAELGWRSLDECHRFEPLLPEGLEVALRGTAGRLHGVQPLADTEGGRYNLVARARLETGGGESMPVFCKRYLLPESAFVEQFAHHVTAVVGMSSCAAVAVPSPEPCLVLSRAPGTKFDGRVDRILAYEIGRQCSFGYLFANADLRPRNAFLTWDTGQPVMTMIDLEHCFFNLALETEGLENPRRPDTFDRLPKEELARRTRKRVLTPHTTRRARRTFMETEGLDTDLAAAFRGGWIDFARQVQRQRDEIVGLFRDRVLREPYLVIGTQSYRRAMAGVDIDDMEDRIGEDPEKNFPVLF
jgi:putative hydrolase of the HAD superfamily